MQRVAVLALCAIAGVAIFWFLVRSGDSTNAGQGPGGTAATTPAASAGSLDPSRRGTDAARTREGSGAQPRSAGGLAADSPAGGAGTGSFDAQTGGAPSGEASLGQRGERDSDARTPLDAAGREHDRDRPRVPTPISDGPRRAEPGGRARARLLPGWRGRRRQPEQSRRASARRRRESPGSRPAGDRAPRRGSDSGRLAAARPARGCTRAGSRKHPREIEVRSRSRPLADRARASDTKEREPRSAEVELASPAR